MNRATALTKPPTPLFGGCPQCRHQPVGMTRQRQLGRAFQPAWHLACDRHLPATNAFHESIHEIDVMGEAAHPLHKWMTDIAAAAVKAAQ
jgi:hypothetical protein